MNRIPQTCVTSVLVISLLVSLLLSISVQCVTWFDSLYLSIKVSQHLNSFARLTGSRLWSCPANFSSFFCLWLHLLLHSTPVLINNLSQLVPSSLSHCKCLRSHFLLICSIQLISRFGCCKSFSQCVCPRLCRVGRVCVRGCLLSKCVCCHCVREHFFYCIHSFFVIFSGVFGYNNKYEQFPGSLVWPAFSCPATLFQACCLIALVYLWISL